MNVGGMSDEEIAKVMGNTRGIGGIPLSRSESFLVCYSPTMVTTNGIWSGDNPLDFALPLFVLQVILVIIVTRGLSFLLKPLRQPRFVGEVIGGVILGPSVLGRIPGYMDVVFPTRSIAILETMANLGLVYFIFLVGLQIELANVNSMGRRAWVVAGSSVSLPFLIEVVAFFTFGQAIRAKSHTDSYLLFLAVSISITAFSVLARILAELKLLNTETGGLAMSASLLNDSLAWVLLALAIALTGKHRSYPASIGIICSGVAFVTATYFLVRLAANWVVAQTNEAEPVRNFYIGLFMLAVMGCAVAADAIGIHAVFGAFAVGVAVPQGPLVVALTEKLEDFVTGVLLPLNYAANGVRVKLESIQDVGTSGFLAGVILAGGAARALTMMVVSAMFYGVSPREGLLLGILMNTKGIMEVMVLRIAYDKKVLQTESYSTMMVVSIVLTASVTPLATLLARPGRHHFVNYKRRMLQRLKPDGELRVIACIHNVRNVPSIVSLIDVAHPTKNSPVFVCAVHLMELTGRESAMLVVQDAHTGSSRHGSGGTKRRKRQKKSNLNRAQAQSEQILAALETYEQHAVGVSVYPFSVVSAYATMHDDVVRIAEDKRTALLVLPFHKQQTVDGVLEVANPGIRTVNQNILAHAPCSVAILVDRGLGGSARLLAAMGRHTAHHVAVLFFGGPDDREALAFACRIAEHPAISLTVLRFVDAEPSSTTAYREATEEVNVVNVTSDADERERTLDDECVKEFRVRYAGEGRVMYLEKAVRNGEETVAAVRGMESVHDLCVVGRGEGSGNHLTAALSDWSDCPELGPIGDLLASSDFAATVSVLVVQQYRGRRGGGGVVGAVEQTGFPLDSPGSGTQQRYGDGVRDRLVVGWAP